MKRLVICFDGTWNRLDASESTNVVHLAEPDDKVLGLIIARSADQQLQYAIEPVPGLHAMTYEVEFRLKDLPQTDGAVAS